jgi:anti-anti-sigma regulatory factor
MEYKHIEPVEEFTDSKNNNYKVIRIKDTKLVENLVAGELKNEIIDCSDKNPDKKVVLDFRDVTYISSHTVGCFIRLNQRSGTLERPKPSLIGLIDECYESFEITKLNKILDVSKDSLEEYKDRVGVI